MYTPPPGVRTSADMPIPNRMKAWVLGGPDELFQTTKPVPVPGRAEVLVRIDAVALCATDLEIIHYGSPAKFLGGLPFNKNFTPGHEYMGTVAALGPDVDEYRIGECVTVEIHAGCGQCKRCRQGMYTACLNYGQNYGDVDKGHRANGFTTDGGFCEYQVNNVNTLVRVPDSMTDEEATLVVTAGTSMYGLTELGGLVAGESVVLNVKHEDAVAVVKEMTRGLGADYVIECAGTQDAINMATSMVNRGGKICLAAFPHDPVTVDLPQIVRNNVYLYGIRGEGRSATHRAMAFMAERRFDARLVHTHSFALDDLPEALRHARDRVDDAIKVVVKTSGIEALREAAE